MPGINADTGKSISGAEEVEQAIECIMITPQGTRVMREWFGNPGLKLLGENMTDETIMKWWSIVFALIELFEPRAEIVAFDTNALNRDGSADLTFVFRYRPYALADFVQARAYVALSGDSVRIVAE